MRPRPAIATGAVALLVVLVAGCSAYPRERIEVRIPPALGTMATAPDQAYGIVEVLFVTDRKAAPDARGAEFGAERGRRLSYGFTEVSIPHEHYRGRLVDRWLGAGKPEHAVTALRTELLHDARRQRSPDAFWTRLLERVEQSPRREVLVMVHGFATTFERATLLAAQIAHDVRFDGVPIAYSWSTQGSVLSYLVDGANAEWTVPLFADFLDQLVHESGAERIHVCAHSLGTQVVARGVRELLVRAGWTQYVGADGTVVVAPSESAGRPRLFDQIILAAGDFDAEIFERDYLPSLLIAAERLTIYMSRSDRALGLSSRMHGFDRIGQRDVPHVDLALLQRADVVDVTDFDRDFYGHSYHARSPRVLADMQAVLDQGDWRAECYQDDVEQGDTLAEKRCRGLLRNYYYRMQPLER